MERDFALEVLPDENEFEAPGEISEDEFVVDPEDEIERPGDDRGEVIRDRRY